MCWARLFLICHVLHRGRGNPETSLLAQPAFWQHAISSMLNFPSDHSLQNKKNYFFLDIWSSEYLAVRHFCWTKPNLDVFLSAFLKFSGNFARHLDLFGRDFCWTNLIFTGFGPQSSIYFEYCGQYVSWVYVVFMASDTYWCDLSISPPLTAVLRAGSMSVNGWLGSCSTLWPPGMGW